MFIKLLKYFAFGTISLLGLVSVATAETFTVNCNSVGQRCDKFATVQFQSEGISSEYGLILSLPRSSCSSVRYFVSGGEGNERQFFGVTPFLNPGESFNYISLGRNLARGTQTVRIFAEGRLGGCNTGRLGAWTVEVDASIVPQ